MLILKTGEIRGKHGKTYLSAPSGHCCKDSGVLSGVCRIIQ